MIEKNGDDYGQQCGKLVESRKISFSVGERAFVDNKEIF